MNRIIVWESGQNNSQSSKYTKINRLSKGGYFSFCQNYINNGIWFKHFIEHFRGIGKHKKKKNLGLREFGGNWEKRKRKDSIVA